MRVVTTPLGNGVYTITEAAWLAGVSRRQALAWFKGWTPGKPGVLGTSDYADLERPDLVSFLDLVDVLVVGELRKLGIPMPAVRRAYRAISTKLNSQHPFGRQELLMDSKGTLFIYAAEEAGDKSLTELVSGQTAWPQILHKFLKKIHYDPQTRFARSIPLGKNVAIHSARRYGKPIVVSANMPTALLAMAYKANDKDADLVADWYNVEPSEVMDAVAFQERFSGIAA